MGLPKSELQPLGTKKPQADVPDRVAHAGDAGVPDDGSVPSKKKLKKGPSKKGKTKQYDR